tara:strand:+ start:1607 stop:1774 length:168 start_codon:yes stop_codon:yes gene_type:complete
LVAGAAAARVGEVRARVAAMARAAAEGGEMAVGAVVGAVVRAAACAGSQPAAVAQ